MLKHWMTHAEYQHFISDSVSRLNGSQLKKLNSYKDSLDKLTSLNLDPVWDYLAPFYSYTGRPALNQPQIIRSFSLMLDLHYTSLDKWVHTLQDDDLLVIMSGCHPGLLPPLESYFDFIDRLWLQNPHTEHVGHKDLLPARKNSKPSKKPGKGKKLPNRHSGITKKIADYVASQREIHFHFERALHELFLIAAVVPSLELGLIDRDNLSLSGDGTCVHTHANPNGHGKCDYDEGRGGNCKCPRHYSDPDASFG